MVPSPLHLRRIDKSKVLSLMLHAADISHPTKQWTVHSRWTKALMEEFFRQVPGLCDLSVALSCWLGTLGQSLAALPTLGTQ